MIYWKAWGDPRNDYISIDHLPEGQWDEIRNTGPQYFSHIKPKGKNLTIFELEGFSWSKSFCRWHQQSHHMGGTIWDNMDERFEHNDKLVYVFNKTIKPEHIKVIGEATIEFNRCEKANIRLKV